MITPEQLRNAARFGQSIRPETLEWLADQLEGKVTQPSEMTEPTIDLDELIRLLTQAIEYLSPSSANPDSAPICIICPDDAKAILASLEELKRIKAVKVPVEPEVVKYLGCSDISEHEAVVVKEYIDTLLDLLKRESARADTENREVLRLTVERNTAESKLAAVMKLGKDPTQETVDAGTKILNEVTTGDAHYVFTAMFAKLVEQAGVKK